MSKSDLEATMKVLGDLQLDPKVKEQVLAAIDRKKTDPVLIFYHGIEGEQPNAVLGFRLSKFLILLAMKANFYDRDRNRHFKIRDFKWSSDLSIPVKPLLSSDSWDEFALSGEDCNDFENRIRNWLSTYNEYNFVYNRSPDRIERIIAKFQHSLQFDRDLLLPALPVFEISISKTQSEPSTTLCCTLMELIFIHNRERSAVTIKKYSHPLHMKITTKGINLHNWEAETRSEPEKTIERYRKIAKFVDTLQKQSSSFEFMKLYERSIFEFSTSLI